MGLAPPPVPPPANGKIDVTPTRLYRVSENVGSQQEYLHKEMNKFLSELERYPDSGGHGSAAEEFSATYKKVGNLFVKVWAKSVVSIGGVAVGFTTTANNYAAADAASDPSGTAQPAHKSPPAVIDSPPGYRDVTDLKWLDSDHGQAIWQVTIEHLEGAVAAVLRPLLEDACRWGKAAEIIPLPDYIGLDAISRAWLFPGVAVGEVNGNLTTNMSGITDQSNSEWYAAMRQFTSAIWGTTAWGGERHGYQWRHDSPSSGSSQPIFAVLRDTCDAMSDAVKGWSDAARTVREEMRRIFYEAVVQALPHIDTSDGVGMKDVKSLIKGVGNMAKGLAGGVVLEIDEAAMNAAVGAYNSRVQEQIPKMKKTLEALEEAYLSAPRFRAEAARAEAFGARSLNDFKHEQKWAGPEGADGGVYKVDLASHEWLNNGHTLDKHVGKSDEQLAQRLRDQGGPPTPSWPHGRPSIGGASTFKSAESAQRLTQHNIDQNSEEIEAWLKGPPPPTNSSRPEAFDSQAPNGETSGRSVTKQPDPSIPGSGYKEHGLQAKAVPVTGVRTVLKYDDSLDPPFSVLTSMPAA